MNLSRSTLRILAIVAACGVAASWLVQRFAVYPEFEAVETAAARDDMRRCEGAIRREIDHVAMLTADYARWDDSWDFMESRSEAYVRSNLISTTFTQTPLSVIFFYDLQGRVVWGECRDEESGEPIDVPEFSASGLPPGHVLLSFTGPGGASGLLQTGAGPMIVTAKPITHTGGEGPRRGTLVMARKLSDGLVERVRELTGVDFRLLPSAASSAQSAEIDTLIATAVPEISEDRDDSLRGRAAIVGVDGTPWLVEADLPRRITPVGAAASRAAAVLHVLIGIVMLVVLHRLLRHRVIHPVGRISGAVRAIADAGDHARRVPEAGPAEIRLLGSDINLMLARLAAAESDLVRARDTAEAAVVAKSRLLADMSHEVRTPMIGVLGMTDHLLDTRLDPEQRECAEMLRRSAHMMLAVLDDVLDASKIEAGRLSLREEEVDLRAVAEGVAEMAAWPAHAKGLQFHCDVDPAVPRRVVGDTLRLRQAFLNLATNAVKFTERGEITVRITACAGPGCGLVRFEVRDTGPGLRPGEAERLFQPFVQVGTAPVGRFAGTGLGLALVRELATRMGGEAGVESVEGQGSTFWFTAALPARESRPRSVSPPLSGRRVLLVARGEDAQRALRNAVHEWAADAACADGITAAADLARAAAAEKRPFDVTILANAVDGGTPEEVAQALRGIAPAIVVIALVPLGRAAPEAGHAPVFSGVAEQPVRAAQLESRIAEAFESADRAARSDPRQSILSPAAMRAARSGSERPPVIPRRRAPAVQAPMEILLVEDNPTNAQLVQLILRKRGYAVTVAVNGGEAVDLAKAREFAVILMDSQMPVMDGVEATRRIRENEAGARRTPVVALTANAMQGERDRFTQAGCDDFVPKPFEVAQLVAAIEKFRPRSAAAESGVRTASSTGTGRR